MLDGVITNPEAPKFKVVSGFSIDGTIKITGDHTAGWLIDGTTDTSLIDREGIPVVGFTDFWRLSAFFGSVKHLISPVTCSLALFPVFSGNSHINVGGLVCQIRDMATVLVIPLLLVRMLAVTGIDCRHYLSRVLPGVPRADRDRRYRSSSGWHRRWFLPSRW